MAAEHPASSTFLTRRRWNPYAVGAGIGLLSWAVFAIVNAPLGVTTSLSAWSALVAEPTLGADGIKSNAYWAKNLPAWDYGTFFLIGTFLGALVGALTSRDFKLEVVPPVWKARFGHTPMARLLVAFVGGALAMYGARMAGGCTSGNGLSGSLQLALSGWTFFLTMFVSGVVTAFLIFGRRSTPVA